jgi:hypothetical protein
MADVTGGISQLLHEAAGTHHRVYRMADGEDPDWASWYADWLISLSELPDLLGTRPVRSELGLPARRPRQGIHGPEPARTLGGLLRQADRRAFQLRQLSTGLPSGRLARSLMRARAVPASTARPQST